MKQILSFYNTRSYLVAGHVFSLTEIEHCILRAHMFNPAERLAKYIVKIWARNADDLEKRPCTAAPPVTASCFRCRPDWRLNVVLNAGNIGSADALPIFETRSKNSFDANVANMIKRTLSCCARICNDSIQLPHTLRRYAGDAPGSPSCLESSELRWLNALLPESKLDASAVTYSKQYGWQMRERLESISATLLTL
jgi:hypothetical protein